MKEQHFNCRQTLKAGSDKRIHLFLCHLLLHVQMFHQYNFPKHYFAKMLTLAKIAVICLKKYKLAEQAISGTAL